MVLGAGLLLAACIPIVTSPTLDLKSRGNVPDNASTVVEVGKSSRIDVLLALGEPDGRGPDDSWFSYGMTHSRSVGTVILVPGAGVAQIIRESQTAQRLVIHFDAGGVVTTAEVSTKKCAHWVHPMSDCQDPAGDDISSEVDLSELHADVSSGRDPARLGRRPPCRLTSML